MKIVKQNPALIFAIVGLLFWLIIWIANIQYDDSGTGKYVFWLGEIFRIPFWVIQEILFALTSGKSFAGATVISIIGGIGMCLGIDIVWRRLSRHK